MVNHEHEDRIYNSLENTDIEVFMKEAGQKRRGACRGGKSLLKSGESCELVGFRGKEDVSLIVESRLVPSKVPGDPDGLEIDLGEEMESYQMECYSISGNKYGFHLHFKEVLSDPKYQTHLDPEIKHPSGSGG